MSEIFCKYNGMFLPRIHFKRAIPFCDTTDGDLSASMRIKRIGIKTRSNGTVRSGLNKIQNLWKTRRRKKKNERRTGREEERAGNGRTGSTYSRGGASQ